LHGIGTEWLDAGLPTPSFFEQINKGYLIAYALNGYFGTQNGFKYLNDIIARFLITFRDERASRLSYPPTITDKSIYSGKIYKLRELQQLKSLKSKNYTPERANSFEDHTFWAIKLYCEDLIREQGIVSAHQLEEFAYSNFEKERSTLRAKCRSIWNYYERKDWQINSYIKKPQGEVMATRQEHIKQVNENRIIKNRNKIKAIIDDIFLQDQIKLKNGKYKIGAIAELTGIHRETVSKHLKEMGLI